MRFEELHNVYFIGIGGIGMSALARWFKHMGKSVKGYDRTETKLTESLQKEGMSIHFEDSLDHIPFELMEQKEHSLVVYTPAIPHDHKEFNWFKEQGFEVMKRSQVLGLITKNMRSVAVAGTHGKTTTSSMVVHLLKSCGIDCAGFLGGISANYETNMVLNKEQDAIAVIEADEFDRSFLTLYPELAVITATDADHLDIYGNKEALKESFRLFVDQISSKGKLFIKNEVADDIVGNRSVSYESYGYRGGEIHASNLKIEKASFIFDYSNGEKKIEGVTLNVPGYHNVENMLAAISISKELGAGDEAIKEAVSTYKGVKRRFEYIIKSEELTFIDDYAHHPVEIDSLLRSVRDLYPQQKITAIFQPHLYSRTQDFANEFSMSLNLADELLMLDIYPARELPIDGVSSELILEQVSLQRKEIVERNSLNEKVLSWKPEVVLTIGAGDIDQLVQPLKEALL